MAVTSTFNYFPSLDQAFEKFKEFAKKNHPDLDITSCSDTERGALLQQAAQSGVLGDPQKVPLHSLREHPLSLDQGGAALVAAPSRVDFQSWDFREPLIEGSLKRTKSHLTYYEEIEKIARELLGPRVIHAWCFMHVLRQSVGSDILGNQAGPIKFVHNDFTERYGREVKKNYTTVATARARYLRTMLKRTHGLELTAEDMSKYRIVILNTWRPITEGPLQRDPLAVCDNRTIKKDELIRRQTDIGKADGDPTDNFALEVYGCQYNPEHGWHYVPNFTNQELLVFKTFDSDMKPFIPTLHSAFELPGQADAPHRESCEARVICLLEKGHDIPSRL